MSAAVRLCWGLKRMSRGASVWKLKPRASSDSCMEERPRSNSTPWTGAKPWSRQMAPMSRKLPSCRRAASPKGDRRARGTLRAGGAGGTGPDQSVGVGVDAEQQAAGRDGFQHGLGVAATAYGAINEDLAGLR